MQQTNSMNPCHASLMAALLALPILGCAPSAHPVKDDPPAVSAPGQDNTPKVTQMGSLQALIRLALDDAARRSQRDASTLTVASAESVTWPDGSLGCPEPGMQYTQALVPGFRIRIRAGAEILEYHAGARGQPFHCPAGRIAGPAAVDPRT
jgi:hypothetical protein